MGSSAFTRVRRTDLILPTENVPCRPSQPADPFLTATFVDMRRAKHGVKAA